MILKPKSTDRYLTKFFKTKGDDKHMLLYSLNQRDYDKKQFKKIIRQMIKKKSCDWQFVKKVFLLSSG